MASKQDAPWRSPSEESHIYPGLCLHDDRQTGSITAGCTRLPLWAFIGELVDGGYKAANYDYEVERCGLSQEALSEFLYCLMELRGDFGRLLLVMAEAERSERQNPRGTSWWKTKKHRKAVREQLRRCLDILED